MIGTVGAVGSSSQVDGRRSLPDDDVVLAAVVDDLLAHGPLDWSMREAGRRIGVSARMLVHRFGSKDQLVAAAFEEIHRRHVAAWLDAKAVSTDADLGHLVADDHLPVIRFVAQLGAIASRDGGAAAELWTATTDDWVDRLVDRLADPAEVDSETARRAARTWIAAVRGIQAEVAISGDVEFGMWAIETLRHSLLAGLATLES